MQVELPGRPVRGAGGLALDDLRLDGEVGAQVLQIATDEPDLAAVVTGPILRSPLSGGPQLQLVAGDALEQLPYRNAQGQPTVQGLAGIPVDLRLKVELLGSRRVVGHRRRHDEPLIQQLASYLHAQLGSGRVPLHEGRSDAESLIGFALLVLDAEHRERLAGKDGGIAVIGRDVFDLGQIDVHEISEGKVMTRPRNEVDAGSHEGALREGVAQSQIHLVGDESRRAIGVDAVEANHGRSRSQ